jgi:uncharacterized membrane protein
MPMIEKFARLQQPVLSEAERDWCRLITRIWCAFFAVNGLTAFALAVAAPVRWWTIYTGGLAYAGIGLLLVGELVLRKRRFRRSGSSSWLDRIVSRMFAQGRKS